MKEKIIVTGGSGFIGTNLISFLINLNKYEIINLDIVEPKIKSHKLFWKNIDLREKKALEAVISDFQPTYVIHLGARTDLNGTSLSDYSANTIGISNLLDALEQITSLKRAIFASSMYVCEPGYIPKDFEDYAPHTLYGESKVETEKRIKNRNPQYTWTIIRPTSIWGPWFGEPYDKFFRIVLNHMYFHMGKRACKKTYGYIDNFIYQIMSILTAPEKNVMKKVFYLGDYTPYDITEWANEIAQYANIRIPQVPYFCFVIMGWLGDLLKKIGVAFPMTSFRLHNMTTDNVHNLNPIKEIAPNLPVTRKQGTQITIDWIKKTES